MRCDLWCLVLRPGLELVPPEYQPFDRVTSSLIRVTVVNLRAMNGYGGEAGEEELYLFLISW